MSMRSSARWSCLPKPWRNEADKRGWSISAQARRFVAEGMLGLADHRPGNVRCSTHGYPDPVATYLVYLKQLYPPIHYTELARIVQRKFGYVTNHSTVKRFLARHPVPVQLPLQFTQFHKPPRMRLCWVNYFFTSFLRNDAISTRGKRSFPCRDQRVGGTT